MAHTKTRPGTAPSAAHTAPDPAPAHDAPTAPGSPAAAVCAALAANPGSTVAVIAGAAATGKPAARAALLAMEAAGTATRVKGAKPGIPDTWTLAGPAPGGTGPADPEAGQDRAAGTSDPAPEHGGEAEAGTSAAPGPEAELAGPDDAVPAGTRPGDAVPDEQDDGEATPDSGPQDPDGSDDPPGEDAPADTGSEAGDAPDPALVTDLTERIAQIKAAADAAAIVLAGGSDLRATLAGLDEIYEQAAQARRSLKAAIGDRKAPAVRPGGLRDKVLAHLDAHPDKEFTPHEIHKVLNHSSGAIANALETLVNLGDAEVATEKPRRFRRAAQPAGAAPGAAGADGAQQDSTELAGAA